MERMTKVDENIQTAQNMLNGIVERCYELEEENKKLRDLKCVPSNLKTLIRIDKENERLEEENKKLKEDLAETQKIGESWRQECKQLREDVDYRHHRCMVAERGGEDED